MMFETIDALRESLAQPAWTPAYAAKMIHVLPAATVVDRGKFVLERCEGQDVLEFGASGPLQARIAAAAARYCGVDRVAGAPGVVAFDLDDVSQATLPDGVAPTVIICGETLEHLSNPGWFLTRLRRQYAGVPVVVTVPNAFSAVAVKQMAAGVENVNVDHVCWYSWRTLKTLVERAGYAIDEFVWYHGDPGTAEGLIMVLR